LLQKFLPMNDILELQKIAAQVRRDVVRMLNISKSGHIGGSLSCADFLTALYFNLMNHNSTNFDIDGRNQDLFFLSNGHIAPVWYSVLARNGYFDIKELSTLRKFDSRLQGHPTPAEHLSGVRIASGSLGQGLSVAIGAALTKKLNNEKNLVFSLHGDGEVQEGQIWEAAMFAAHHKVDNLISVIDYNGKQIDGNVENVMSLGNLRAKWESFGWKVLGMNGNDISDILKVVNEAKNLTFAGKPIMILMKTIMGKGVSFIEDDHKWHGSVMNEEQTKNALEELKETLVDF